MPWQATQEMGVPDAAREEMYFSSRACVAISLGIPRHRFRCLS